MSYILEALRRAETERQRGAVPDLHAQPAGPAGLPLAGAQNGRRRRRAGLLALLVAVLLLALVSAWWLGRGSQPELAPAGRLPPIAAAAPATTPQAVPAPDAPAASARPAWPATEVPATLVPAPAVGTMQATPAAGPASVAAPLLVAAPLPAAAPAVVATATPAAIAAAQPAASAPEPLLRWSALPEATRASLPRLAWSGVVYAELPAQRLLVVNGQVAREGDEIAPGLTLEQIRPRSAVLRWRGQRFEMPM